MDELQNKREHQRGFASPHNIRMSLQTENSFRRQGEGRSRSVLQSLEEQGSSEQWLCLSRTLGFQEQPALKADAMVGKPNSS